MQMSVDLKTENLYGNQMILSLLRDGTFSSKSALDKEKGIQRVSSTIVNRNR